MGLTARILHRQDVIILEESLHDVFGEVLRRDIDVESIAVLKELTSGESRILFQQIITLSSGE